MKPESTKEKILEMLYDYPTKRFHMREIARKINVSATAVSKAVKILEKESLLTFKRGFISEIQANINDIFKNKKKINNLKGIYESKLLDYLKEKFPLTTIVLFGSYSKGEDIERSDIDIVLFAKEKSLELNHFEKKLNRKINIEFIDFKKATKELKESIINGIVLEGSIIW